MNGIEDSAPQHLSLPSDARRWYEPLPCAQRGRSEVKKFEGEPPHCQPLKDWMPCQKSIPGWSPASKRYVPSW